MPVRSCNKGWYIVAFSQGKIKIFFRLFQSSGAGKKKGHFGKNSSVFTPGLHSVQKSCELLFNFIEFLEGLKTMDFSKSNLYGIRLIKENFIAEFQCFFRFSSSQKILGSHFNGPGLISET